MRYSGTGGGAIAPLFLGFVGIAQLEIRMGSRLGDVPERTQAAAFVPGFISCSLSGWSFPGMDKPFLSNNDSI